MNIFDKFDCVDNTDARHGESRFSFLNRSNWPESAAARTRIEDWFSRYPEGGQAELVSRFRDKNDPQKFDSAFFELFLHEYFSRLGCQIEVHPHSNGSSKRPDFLITTSSSSSFYLEAIVATGVSRHELAMKTRLNALYDAINEVTCPDYFLWLSNTNLEPSIPIPVSKVRKEVQRWVNELDYERDIAISVSNSVDELPHIRLEYDAVSLKLVAIPKKRAARGLPDVPPLGNLASTVFVCRTHEDIKSSVKKKAPSRYDLGGLPYVVAVECKDVFARTTTVERAIYGLPSKVQELGLDQRAVADFEEGIWTGKGGARNTTIGGILYINKLFPWHLKDTTVCLFRNPWTTAPIDLAGLPINEAHLTIEGVKYSDKDSTQSFLEIL